MPYYELTMVLHVVLFCYWLGGDLGVWFASKYAADPSLNAESRLSAAKIMAVCDLGPKLSMALMLSVGGVLSHYHGLDHPWWQMAGIVLLAPFWVTLVLVQHFKHSAPYAPLLNRFDFHFRWLLMIGMLISNGWSNLAGRMVADPWLTAKLIIFVILVGFGLMIRINLKGFNETLAKLKNGEVTDADNQAMQSSRAKVVPWVISIWVGLLVAAYLGVVQPGSPEPRELPSPAVYESMESIDAWRMNK